MEGNGCVIRIEKVVSGYGNKLVLHGIDIEIRESEITTLIGRNGVGKTTLMQTIMGFLKPKEGRVVFKGNDISGIKPHNIAKMGVSYVPQGKSIFPHMTIEEHLDLGAWVLTNNEEKISLTKKIYTIFPHLEERKDQKAGTLSGGERQMLSIGRSMMARPKLLLLDEPSFGLSPVMVDTVFQSINAISKEGITVFMVEQNANKALNNSTIGYVMDMGKITFKDKSENLLKNEEVRRSYLGGKKNIEVGKL